MLRLAPSGRLKRGMKRAVKRSKDIGKLAVALDLRLAEQVLPAPTLTTP